MASGLAEDVALAATVVTAVATVALVIFTYVLARATNALVRATSEPAVIVTLEPSLRRRCARGIPTNRCRMGDITHPARPGAPAKPP
jgi:hypothetical protein